MVLFRLGRIVATPGALSVFKDSNEDPSDYVIRHVSGDWGNVSPDDAEMNKRAVTEGDRILSSYRLKNGEKIWIITESDRSATTILLPSEY